MENKTTNTKNISIQEPLIRNEEILKKMISIIKTTLLENKAEQTEVYDVRPGLNYTDIVIVSTAAATQHIKALYTYVREAMKENGFETLQPSKKISENYWQILDFGDIVVHIILKENRDFYRLDELYAKLSVNG